MHRLPAVRIFTHSFRRSWLVFLTLASLSQAKAIEEDTTFVVAGIPYRVSGLSISVQDKAGWKEVASFPKPSFKLVIKYRPDVGSHFGYDSTQEKLEDILTPAGEIGVVTVAENKIWVGFSYYEGEGSEGVGGIGFYDPETAKIGILRHPALVDCSVEELMITEDTIYAKTGRIYEGAETYGNGIVCINRHSLNAAARVPVGPETVSDREDETPKNTAYDRSVDELVADRSLIAHDIPTWTVHDQQIIRQMGPVLFMISTAQQDLQIK